ncbi:MAG: hypothetical protein A3F67_01875 [Verrucomicrobia bacterium RIFCSPHIGHO2_12_FULL_41_10]|nr:MAG: hypothetical protein A3F67_01875 [Verrucomicrobia bacterium RIFCSPHIGHO2_12_FULL_41_10]
MKQLLSPLVLALFSLSGPSIHADSATNPSPEFQEIPSTPIKTPSKENFQYAPKATEVFLEASVFAKALERIINTLPSDFSNREDAIAYLKQTNAKVDAIETLMKQATNLQGSPSPLTQQEILNYTNLQVAGILARTDLLIDLLSIVSSPDAKSRPEEMDLKVLQFMEDLASTVSEMKEGLEEDAHGVQPDIHSSRRGKKHRILFQQTPKQSIHADYFNVSIIEATLTRELKESLLDLNPASS